MNKTFTLNEIKKVAENLVQNINKKKLEKSTVIALSGDLGVGKTTLTQEIGKILGVKEKIVSPTFVIMKRYKISYENFEYLIHVDAYRLKNSQELFNLGWNELTKNKNNLIIIEWPEIVPECLDQDIYKVTLKHKNEKTRIIKTLL